MLTVLSMKECHLMGPRRLFSTATSALWKIIPLRCDLLQIADFLEGPGDTALPFGLGNPVMWGWSLQNGYIAKEIEYSFLQIMKIL